MRKSVNMRQQFVKNHLFGLGLEIGAMHSPLPYNKKTTKMHYCDVRTRAELIDFVKTKPKVALSSYKDIPNTDVIGSSDDLSNVPDNKYDFTCSSHVFEHAINFGKSIEESLRIVKKGGHVYCIVPDKRYTHDKDREETTFKDLVEIYESDPELNYDEVGFNHKNRFTEKTVFKFLDYLQPKLNFKILGKQRNGMNIFFYLQKI